MDRNLYLLGGRMPGQPDERCHLPRLRRSDFLLIALFLDVVMGRRVRNVRHTGVRRRGALILKCAGRRVCERTLKARRRCV